MSDIIYDHVRALNLLRLGTGDEKSTFREGQEEAISHIVEGRGRLLVVQKTGWGKSFVYFIATKLLRENGKGPAILISPLLSLMRNQGLAAERMGVRADRITSEKEDEKETKEETEKRWREVAGKLVGGELDILLIAPERLENEYFKTKVLPSIASNISMLVIDEVHCISDWGHDFRPHYRMIKRIMEFLPSNTRLLATTATANKRVMEDLRDVLGLDPNRDISRGDLNRESLSLQTILLDNQAERLAWLAERLDELPGSGIIYVLTVRDANQVASWLDREDRKVEAYSSKETDGRKKELEQALLNNQVKALVATTALGMGFDKPDLAFVIHYQMPGSVIAYYQQVGRAGRALKSAYGVLLGIKGEADLDINNWFINSAFPTRSEVEEILGALNSAKDGLSISDLCGRLNLKQGRVQHTTLLLSLEQPSPIVKQGGKWYLTPAKLTDEFWGRVGRLTDLRKEELVQMQEYVKLPFGEHMTFLIKALDGDPNAATPPKCPELPSSVNKDWVQKAVIFLKRTGLPIEPRKRWRGLSEFGITGNIDKGHQAQSGKSLCAWGDAGWGCMVKQDKQETGRFRDDLVEACVNMIREWGPTPKPTWVTCIPSLRRPVLVPDFAKRLATALGLPFCMAIEKIRDTPEQKTMQNSEHQARNVYQSLKLNHSLVQKGPVLLVDDIVDSRWTLTVAAWLLREGKSDEVWPIALADAGHDE